MTTDVDQGYFAWSQEELTQRDASTGVTISQMLDHGSVSFGKFEFESLSWEKWSVFRHDRRQEELEKFNGLVAEKKAYFEEYYKRMRALKALQQQQQQQEEQAQQHIQQTELTLDYSVDGSLSEEEHETGTGRRTEAEMETGTAVEERTDVEGSTVVETSGVGENKLEKPAVGDARKTDERGRRLVSKKPIDRRANSKEPSSSTRSRPGPKQNLKPQTRSVVHKPQPPPPPPLRKIIRKADNTGNLKVRQKEATKTVPVASITTSTVATTKRPSSSASMRRPVNASVTTTTTSTIATTKRPSSSASVRSPVSASVKTTSTIATTKRPSSSASTRRPVSSSGNRPSSTPQRPLSSAGDRGRGIREKVQRSDLSSNRIESVSRGKMGPSIHSTPRMNIIPSTIKSITTESRRQVPKETLILNKNPTTVKRAERYTLDTKKSRSINLPPKKNASTSSASETFSRNKTKEAPIKGTTQPRSSAQNNVMPSRSNTPLRNTALSHATESSKIGTPRKPIPPRTSETPRVGSRPRTSCSSVSSRKPKAETKTWR